MFNRKFGSGPALYAGEPGVRKMVKIRKNPVRVGVGSVHASQDKTGDL